MNRLALIFVLIFPLTGYSDSILPIRQTSEWVSTVEFDASELIDGNAIFLESLDAAQVLNISMNESFKYMNEDEQWEIRFTQKIDSSIESRYFIITEKLVFPTYAREMVVNTQLKRTNVRENGNFDLQPDRSKVWMKAELTLRGNDLYRVNGGFALKGSNAGSPKLLSYIDIAENHPSSELVVNEVNGKVYKQVHLLTGTESIPLAYISKTEKPKIGVYWEVGEGKQLFALTVIDHVPDPEGMGAKCQSRTVVYEVADNKYTQQSDAGFQCYVH
ncbi:hypothetical protein [Agaribacterium sp. ZY112]|uniref:hypothetical protein n=1 Tax=Agaribacterium sp. ZY112 TaxID=3233574 RepID=UPI003525DA5D